MGNFEFMKQLHKELITSFRSTPPRHGEPLGGIERAKGISFQDPGEGTRG